MSVWQTAGPWGSFNGLRKRLGGLERYKKWQESMKEPRKTRRKTLETPGRTDEKPPEGLRRAYDLRCDPLGDWNLREQGGAEAQGRSWTSKKVLMASMR